MRTLKIVGAAAYLLALMAPAMAANNYGLHRHFYGRAAHGMRAQDYNHWDYGIARPSYHSGWGGPYDDGEYPGSADRLR